jgi:hypothetical protein
LTRSKQPSVARIAGMTLTVAVLTIGGVLLIVRFAAASGAAG